MPDDTLNITAAELRILKILWRIGNGTVRDVKEQLAAESEEPPAYTTVMTLMNQLAAKSALAVDRGRQPFVYSPAVQRENVLTQRLKQFLNTVFDGQAGELVLRLVEEADISAEDLKRIERKIDARERDGHDTPNKPDAPGKGRKGKEGRR